MGDLSEHFSRWEFKCKCRNCGKWIISEQLIETLEDLRKVFGKPIIINSGYRCELYNKDVGGSKNSQHLYGRAADIIIRGISPSDIAKEAKKLFSGLGVYRTFIHVDVRPGRKARWTVR